MSREVSGIKEFKYGVISSVDEEDIPSESASDSLNVDGDVGEGILQGIPTDIEILIDSDRDNTIDDAIAYIKQGEFIEHDGIYDLIYHDQQNDTISVITDFYSTAVSPTTKTKLNIVSSLASNNVTMTLQNQQVHIGVDANHALWVGRMDHGQFSYGTSWLVSSIANSAGEIAVTLKTTHSLKDGDIVKISGTEGTHASTINGIWVIKTINNFAKTFVLTGSSYVGTTVTADTGSCELYLTVQYAECINFEGASDGYFRGANGGGAGVSANFASGIYSRWGLSFTYDGTQESPIVETCNATSTADFSYYPITITSYGSTPTAGSTTPFNSFNKRITAVNLYRADSIDDTVVRAGLYRLVASLDINSDQWTTSTADKIILVKDYNGFYSLNAVVTAYPGNPVTYEENSGMPENLTSPSLYYALSTSGGGYHFVTKCTQINLTGSELRRIFKSKYFRYDMFDYYTDFIEMPEPIVAIKYYEGFLYASGLNKIYRINIEGFYIQDVYEDAGCHDQFSIHANEQGMFFANYNNAWMYRGGSFTRIGDAIRQSASSGKSWATFIGTNDLYITSDAKKGYVLFINERTDTTSKVFAWGYHPAKERWDCFSFADYASVSTNGYFKGKDGEVYHSNATKTYKLMRHTTNRQAWEWYSQDFIFGESRQKKSIVMIKIDATGTVSINYGFEGATVNVSYTNEALINEYKKSIRVKLNAAAATSSNWVDSMEVIWRPLIGKR